MPSQLWLGLGHRIFNIEHATDSESETYLTQLSTVYCLLTWVESESESQDSQSQVSSVILMYRIVYYYIIIILLLSSEIYLLSVNQYSDSDSNSDSNLLTSICLVAL